MNVFLVQIAINGLQLRPSFYSIAQQFFMYQQRAFGLCGITLSCF